MKKLFKFILNTIPRPVIIRLSYVIRPVLALVLKGDKYTDPIDGKSFKNFYLTAMGTNAIMYCHRAHFHLRGTACYGYT